MGLGDETGNEAEELAGTAKEAAGEATGNERLEAEGKAEQGKAGLEQAGESVEDAFRRDWVPVPHGPAARRARTPGRWHGDAVPQDPP
ncbi:CsbD family protein [Geodermatophilus sp. FMUSA9-8]|uniref:CsbD family protein n=1 Tax=Geodermatophilus sp. FMUSA9-8 TaxID=3120155 RepID=UPI00300AFB0B